MTILDTVRAAYAAGLCPIPVREDGSKAPDVSTWRAFQTTRPTPAEMRTFDFAHRAGYGVVGGGASGGIDPWDFDDAGTFQAFVASAESCGLGPLVARIRGGYEDETPSGGRRWLVRYLPTLSFADTVLARRPGRKGEPKTQTLIEITTFSILAPSGGATHPTGRPYVRVSGDFATIATYDAQERDDLMELARNFDEMPRQPTGPKTPKKRPTHPRPGDEFNARKTWPALLEPEGWRSVFTRDGVTHWRRPGKTCGSSATTNYGGSDLLWVFSSSTEFDADKSYSKFAVYTLWHHGGDFHKAALALANEGFGTHVDTERDRTRAARTPPVTPCTLSEVSAVFTRWLGPEYDLGALQAVLATAAAEHLTGDPLWLLVISGPGNAKTETVQALAGAGALVTSTISSEGALLSGSALRDHGEDSTGGLLRRIGGRGVLVIKDATSILAMNRDTRASLLAAMREIHDGRWERNVGTDGGRSLLWTGRLVVVGAVTTAWDRAHDVIASLGDRFVLVRMDSTVGRMAAGRQACRNTGEESRMREELAAVVGGVLAMMNSHEAITLTENEQERLLEAANVVTLARTGVDYDYRGDVIDAHAPEMPTRFAKQLTQLVRGAVALGLERGAAVCLAIRCARDSMPPLRLAILSDIAAQPGSQTRDVRRRLEKPRATVDRQLQSLHMLGILICDEEEGFHRGESVTRWHYRLAPGINPRVFDLASVPEKSPQTGTGTRRETERQIYNERVIAPPDFSGAAPELNFVTEPAESDTNDPNGVNDIEDNSVVGRFDLEFVVLRGGYAAPVVALQLLWRLEAAGVRMQRDGDDILVQPLSRLTPADRDSIRRWKRHLLMLVDYEVPPM